jgi:hypothetical protein
MRMRGDLREDKQTRQLLEVSQDSSLMHIHLKPETGIKGYKDSMDGRKGNRTFIQFPFMITSKGKSGKSESRGIQFDFLSSTPQQLKGMRFREKRIFID